MQVKKNILDCYNKTAKNYADKFIDELSKKHLDRILLKAFAEENAEMGKLADLGCGPGHTTKYLYECGVTDMLGIDISSGMVAVAKSIHPHLNFEEGDISSLKYPDKFFSSAIAFYSIVHFDYEGVRSLFKEIKRVLKSNSQFLFSFHTGEQVIHLETFLEHSVSIDFYFFETKKIVDLLREAGFEIVDIIEREPYPHAEHASKAGIHLGGNILSNGIGDQLSVIRYQQFAMSCRLKMIVCKKLRACSV